MRKRNDAIVSESVSDGKRGIGSSRLEITDSVSLIASTTMSIASGTVSISGDLIADSKEGSRIWMSSSISMSASSTMSIAAATVSISGDLRADAKGGSKLWMSNSVSIAASTTMSLSAGTVSIYGDVLLKSIAQTSSEQKILYMSDSGNLYYRTGIPLSLVLSASNSTGENDIFFLNGRKSYSTYGGLTSSYTFASGTSAIRSEGGKDYSQIYSASQSSYIMNRKYGSIEGESKIRTYSTEDFTYADISVKDMGPTGIETLRNSESYLIAKTGKFPAPGTGEYGSASVSIGAKVSKIGTSDDREAKITLRSDGFMLTDLGNQNYFNTKFSSSVFATDLTTGSQSVVTIPWDGSNLSEGFNPAEGGVKVAISVKAWVLANYDSPVPGYSAGGAYHAEHFALFVKTGVSEMTRASISSTEEYTTNT